MADGGEPPAADRADGADEAGGTGAVGDPAEDAAVDGPIVTPSPTQAKALRVEATHHASQRYRRLVVVTEFGPSLN